MKTDEHSHTNESDNKPAQILAMLTYWQSKDSKYPAAAFVREAISYIMDEEGMRIDAGRRIYIYQWEDGSTDGRSYPWSYDQADMLVKTYNIQAESAPAELGKAPPVDKAKLFEKWREDPAVQAALEAIICTADNCRTTRLIKEPFEASLLEMIWEANGRRITISKDAEGAICVDIVPPLRLSKSGKTILPDDGDTSSSSPASVPPLIHQLDMENALLSELCQAGGELDDSELVSRAINYFPELQTLEERKRKKFSNLPWWPCEFAKCLNNLERLGYVTRNVLGWCKITGRGMTEIGWNIPKHHG